MTGVTALVRSPGPRLAEGMVTHVQRREVDGELAARQWSEYVRALRDAGWQTVQVPPADDCPDAVFVEDAVVMVGGLAVLTRPGAPSRRPEVAEVGSALTGLGYPVTGICSPGTLDGGDVLKVGDTVYVGRGGRTNADGVAQLRSIVQPLGFKVVVVPLTRVLHLKSAVTALPDGRVIGWPPAVDQPELFPDYLAVPEEAGAHVVVLGDGRLLMSAAAPRSAQLFSELGYAPVLVDIGEFEKLEGCVTCLSVRLRQPPR